MSRLFGFGEWNRNGLVKRLTIFTRVFPEGLMRSAVLFSEESVPNEDIRVGVPGIELVVVEPNFFITSPKRDALLLEVEDEPVLGANWELRGDWKSFSNNVEG